MINHLKQVATWWSSTPDGLGGYSFGTPVAINCRWEDNSLLLPNSSTEASRAVAYLDRDVSIEDYIILGTSVATNPTVIGALQVKAIKKVPDLRSMDSLRKVWLQ